MNIIILTMADHIRDAVYRITDNRAKHIRTVLRAAVGDDIHVGLLDGPAGKARVDEISPDGVVLSCDLLAELSPPAIEVDIVCALPRPQTLKKVLLTAAMMSVRRLYLTRANRVEKSYFHSPLLEPENCRRFLIEGLSQGRRTRLPIVTVHERFRRFFEDDLGDSQTKPVDEVRLLPSLETKATLSHVLARIPRSLVLAIGPEGGWVPFEEELMTSLGFQPFRLGPWTLRVEHAVTAALAQIELACGGQ